ncbi:hypothetical protein ACJX0J_016985, partial [Zea mays]
VEEAYSLFGRYSEAQDLLRILVPTGTSLRLFFVVSIALGDAVCFSDTLVYWGTRMSIFLVNALANNYKNISKSIAKPHGRLLDEKMQGRSVSSQETSSYAIGQILYVFICFYICARLAHIYATSIHIHTI